MKHDKDGPPTLTINLDNPGLINLTVNLDNPVETKGYESHDMTGGANVNTQNLPKCLVYDARMVFQARAVLGDVMRAEAGKSGPTARTERTRRAATRIFNQYWPVRPKRVP